MGQGRGWEGAVLKLFRAKDFTFTVTGAEDVTADYRRVRFTDGGMLAATFLAIFFVPLFFVLITKISRRLFRGGRPERPVVTPEVEQEEEYQHV